MHCERCSALVIAGSYEGGLHGWTFDNDNYELKFSFAAHQGCIRCVATNSHVEDAQPLLLTGGDDEVIRAFSLYRSGSSGNYQNTRARSRTCVSVAASILPVRPRTVPYYCGD